MNLKRLIVGMTSAALLTAGAAGVVGPGIAQAHPGGPMPLSGAWPGCPADHPAGPCHWCPGDPPVQTGNLAVDPVVWDDTICHTYWYAYPYGNVAKTIFEGETPPVPPPPPYGLYCDPGTFFQNCRIDNHP